MLSPTPWDFSDPTFFKVGETFGKTLYVTEFPSFNEQNLFFQELYERTDDFKVSLYIKGVDLFRAQSIVEKQIQSDQGALWKRKNVMNFDAQAALGLPPKRPFPRFGKENITRQILPLHHLVFQKPKGTYLKL